MDDAVAIASTSTAGDSVISFQYQWPLKVCQRQIEDEPIILTLSRPFCTSFNHVQFTWALRLTDEYVLSNNINDPATARHVLLHAYYKEGPCREVAVEEIRAEIKDPITKEVLFAGLVLGNNEFTRQGSGWPVQVEKEQRHAFTQFIHERIDANLLVIVEISMKVSLFEPLNYLPDVETAFRSQRIENACNAFIDDVLSGKVNIPNMDLLKQKDDGFSMHRLVFSYGVDVLEDFLNDQQSEVCSQLVKKSFAHVYFERVLLRDVRYIEDFVALLEGITSAHIPLLRKELERFICQEVIQEPMDPNFAKRMLLIAEKYNLDVLKMVANGVVVDHIIANSNPPKELVNVTHELAQIAREIKENELVGVVVEDLHELTRRVRRVSLSHSPSQSSHNSSSSPIATPTETSSGSTSPASDRQSPTFPDSPGPSSPASRFKRVSLV